MTVWGVNYLENNVADKLNINLRYCYGIGKLETELEFKHKGYAIYAPNGVMKTSFAKTMMDLSEGNTPKDLHFPDREPTCEITLNGEGLKKEEVFVVKSYDDKFSSSQVSTLLANAELRTKYERIHQSIGEAKKALDKALRNAAGFGERSRENLDPIIEDVFSGSYYEALSAIEDELTRTSQSDLSKADYKIIYDPKVQQFLSSEDVAAAVEDFAQKYDEITEQSPILRRNFQYHNVAQVQQQLEANNFFSAGHRISLADEKTDQMEEVSSDQSLRQRIEDEKLRVLNDEAVAKKFDTFNSKLKNKELQTFRDYITENKQLLPMLSDPEGLKRDLWMQYLRVAFDEYKTLVSEYRTGQSALAEIVKEADESRGDWDAVVADFNRRFLYLPFELSVENKADAILKGIAPSIAFVVKDAGEERRYASSEKQDLLRALSTGESRALYILDIMYEVFVRWKNRAKTLFVFDDISDSFDYKNKFAIIDFLEDVTKVEDTNFLAIVLTHNFDFLRTVSSRQICPAHQCRLAFRSDDGIKLEPFERTDIQSPFRKWQGRLAEPSVLIAYIPFLRNLIEYTLGAKDADGNANADYLQLTRMLHFKDETDALTIQDYKTVFESHLVSCTFPNIDLSQRVIDYLFAAADACENVADGINLEHKIALSIAIRVWAERYMIAKIRSSEPEYGVAKKQTGELFQKFKDLFNNQADTIGLLRRVNLITPANIHLNAFMYEPILDMGMAELVTLYQDVKSDLN
ncbi:hypothetical protein SAMN04488045_3909 [Thalassococcus halodurans]|jgi:hypothetical protein|uniref:Uncharacterized protein n=2 Tax=Alphaproteobacteria TaxID=28211 RepID=A0A1H6C0H2_9RHOB|nr:hypothetical protein SAMN04488045_3909 [Thalassococcus halodurans]